MFVPNMCIYSHVYMHAWIAALNVLYCVIINWRGHCISNTHDFWVQHQIQFSSVFSALNIHAWTSCYVLCSYMCTTLHIQVTASIIYIYVMFGPSCTYCTERFFVVHTKPHVFAV